MEHYGEKLKSLINEYDLKIGFMAKKLDITRFVLKNRINDGKFKTYQKKIIDELIKKLQNE